MIYHDCRHLPRLQSAMSELSKFYADVWPESPAAYIPLVSGKLLDRGNRSFELQNLFSGCRQNIP